MKHNDSVNNKKQTLNRALIYLFLTPASVFAANCDGALGEWKWFNGGTVTLTPQKTVLMNGKAEGKWTCSDPNHDALVVRWNAGFIDNLAAAGGRLTGKNQQGVPISASRKPAAAHK